MTVFFACRTKYIKDEDDTINFDGDGDNDKGVMTVKTKKMAAIVTKLMLAIRVTVIVVITTTKVTTLTLRRISLIVSCVDDVDGDSSKDVDDNSSYGDEVETESGM